MPTTLTSPTSPGSTGRARLLCSILWPIALLTVAHRVLVRAVNGALTNDFGTVYVAGRHFLAGLPVYGESLETVDPHYLYAPSGTLLLAPFAVIDDYVLARWLFIALNVGAILVALALLMRLFDLDLRGPAAPLVLLAAFSTEAVTNTLVFTNVNGVVFCCQATFLYLLHRRRLFAAGIPMGLSLAIKPMLAPLLVLPLVRKQWQPFVAAALIPAVTLAAGWSMTADAGEYLHRTVPYMRTVRDYYNSSLAGIGVYYDIPEPVVLAWRVVVVAAVLAAVWALLPYRFTDEVLWLCTTSGVILAGVFLVSSLGQAYYSMTLFPLMMTVVCRASLVRSWPAWLAAYAFLTPDIWESLRWPGYGRMLEYVHPTLGWLLIVGVVLVTALWRRSDPAARERVTPAPA